MAEKTHADKTHATHPDYGDVWHTGENYFCAVLEPGTNLVVIVTEKRDGKLDWDIERAFTISKSVFAESLLASTHHVSPGLSYNHALSYSSIRPPRLKQKDGPKELEFEDGWDVPEVVQAAPRVGRIRPVRPQHQAIDIEAARLIEELRVGYRRRR